MKKSTKVLVLGQRGMLGSMVFKVFSKNESVICHGTETANLNSPFYFSVEEGLGRLEPIFENNNGYDYVINCIAILNNAIDPLNPSSVDRAIRVNAQFPQQLASFAENKKVKVIHMSTDGVFSGRDEVYDELAPSDCTDTYGKTKSLGEAVCQNVINIRCSIVGPSPEKKGGLFEWFCSQDDGAEIFGYTNHIWNGVTTLQFAKLCETIIEREKFDDIRDESPIHHFSPNNSLSKFGLLEMFREVTDKRIILVPKEDPLLTLKRILTTRHHQLKEIFGFGASIKGAIKEFYELI